MHLYTMVALLAVAPLFSSQQEAARQVTLDFGLSFSLPGGWTVLSEEELGRFESGLAFAANLYDSAGVTMAVMNVRRYTDTGVTQDEVAAMGASEILELDASLRSSVAASEGYVVTDWLGTTPRAINGLVALVTRYRRMLEASGEVATVDLVRVLAGDRSFTLTVSQSDPNPWLRRYGLEPIIESLRLVPPEMGGSMGGNRDLLDPMSLLFSFAFTWVVGLAPVLALRFLLLRRPLSKGIAVGIASGLWVFNLLLFTSLGSRSTAHTALFFVAVVSYWILSRGVQPDSPTERIV